MLKMKISDLTSTHMNYIVFASLSSTKILLICSWKSIFVVPNSGCSLVRLKCWSGGPEIGGSNPLIPTNENHQ